MGKSLFGQLKGLLSREKRSKVQQAEELPASSSNLSRIGLGGAAIQPEPAAEPDQAMEAPGMAAPSVQMTPMPDMAASQADASPVSIQFFAEVPLQQSAEEIITVSQRGSNCVDATVSPSGDGNWTVAITLRMLPVPQQIHTVESVLAAWAAKLGGSSKGWGLAQGQAA